MKRTAIMGLAIACLTFGVAACSSDSDSGTTASTNAPTSTSACEKLDPAQLAAAIPGSTFTLETAADLPLTSGGGDVMIEHGADCSFTVAGVDVWTEASVGIYAVPEGSSGSDLVTDALAENPGGCDAPPIGETSGFYNGLGFATQGDVIVTAFFPDPVDANGTDLSAGSPHEKCALVVSLLEAATPLAAA